MNIYCDRHHSGLAHSLHLLFEKRLGANLYFPIGMSWFPDWWRIAEPYGDNLDTAKQYLQIKPEYKPMDGTVPLNHIVKELPTHYEVEDLSFGYIQKCITLAQFIEMDIDIIIASYAPHIPVYKKLIEKCKPKAKLIHQQGNEWAVDFGQCKNLLASVMPYNVPNDVNAVFYHQEFSLDLFKPENSDKKIIRSFVNTLSTQSLFEKDWTDFLELEIYLPEYKFESYGAGCRDGVINEQSEIARLMQESKYAFHLKTGGDGYGHSLFSFMACGKPVIYRGSQYKNRLASKLLIHGETGFDLDQAGVMSVVNSIGNQSLSDYDKMSNNMQNLFKKYVRFDLEEQKIRKFIQNLR